MGVLPHGPGSVRRVKQAGANARVSPSDAVQHGRISGKRGAALVALLFTVLLPVLPSCGGVVAANTPPQSVFDLSLPKKTVGTLAVLTYNVAGLPALVSASNPDVNMRQVSPHLNRYDIVLAQEDFSYHEELVGAVRHPFQLPPQHPGSGLVGDGLTTLSNYPVSHQTRQTWRACSGYLLSLNDCLGDKGFSVAHVNLSSTVAVHVYNLHADAGAGEQDVLARAEGFEQLAEFIEQHSKGAALIVGGDTNLDPSDPRDHAILDAFLRRTGLTDACLALGCAETQIDRIFFRSSRRVELHIEAWHRDETFADASGAALSDHPAIAARIGWQLVLDPIPSAVAHLEPPLTSSAAANDAARVEDAPAGPPSD